MTQNATETSSGQDQRSVRRRQLSAAFVGNVVEWFDWYVYSILAVYFSTQFFPKTTGSSLVPLLATLAIFAAGFFARPLGGLLFGALADRFGRKRVLSATIVGMGAGSLMIGLAPTYAQAGLLAPAILLLARIVQGLSAGGEYAAGSAFLVEAAPDRRRGLYSSFFYVSATTANLAAIGLSALLSNVLSDESMSSWGWRIPFLVGSVGAVVGLWVRKHAEETLTDASTEKRRRRGYFDFLRQHPRESFLVFGLTAGPVLVFYTFTSYLPTYANITVGFDLKYGLVTGAVALAWFLALQPIFGMLSDRIGRKPMLFAFGVFFIVGTVPLLGSLRSSFVSVLLVQMLGLTFIACWSSISSAVVAELFPAHIRGSGIGFPYALAVAVFGGTGPYIATWLVGQDQTQMFGWYISVVVLFSTVAFFFLPETARSPLR
ncbi:MFS transporter [Rhodococcus sp. 14-2483-1-2]|uniref:MFS transporter n=1 Tax=Rhodococcus sp. 14-2483-1-2 TaxID=2023147 RepID=UPI000B9A4AA3|nr:MFS transporter [Rhodococcus sp. 14-2483-1-2]OZF26121.1 MFS transporter [Rhodococcus sp. 14-2483-1-2]